MKNPCRKCLVQSMCKDPCDEFTSALKNSRSFMKKVKDVYGDPSKKAWISINKMMLCLYKREKRI